MIKNIVAKSVHLQKYSDMSRERKTGSNNRKPATNSKPKSSERSSKPKFEKKIEKREPRILNNSEVNSFEKSFTAKPSRSAVGKRVGKSFDSSAKFEKGDYKAGPKKVFKNFDKNFGKDMTAEKTKSFVLKRRFDKIANETPKDTIRLNKYIANSGICSRREADTLITQGLVEVNGKVTTEMGYQVEKTDRVVFDGNSITPEKPVYVLLNKPKGYISTTKDEKARKTVMDLVENASPYRTFPVGRLDRQTTGVILLTNDGHITKKLTHPSFNLKKIYHVSLDRKLTNADLQQIKDGVRLEEGVAEVDSISFIEGKPKNEVGIEIHIGWNRVVRRIFRKLGYEVETLDRVMFAGLTKKNIKRGHWRILTELEVNTLKML